MPKSICKSGGVVPAGLRSSAERPSPSASQTAKQRQDFVGARLAQLKRRLAEFILARMGAGVEGASGSSQSPLRRIKTPHPPRAGW
jgi:hypothetical protein